MRKEKRWRDKLRLRVKGLKRHENTLRDQNVPKNSGDWVAGEEKDVKIQLKIESGGEGKRKTTNNNKQAEKRVPHIKFNGKQWENKFGKGKAGKIFNEDGKTWFQTNESVYVSFFMLVHISSCTVFCSCTQTLFSFQVLRHLPCWMSKWSKRRKKGKTEENEKRKKA